MDSKKNIFLSSLFKGLDEAAIGYCISRNADETFANTGSDLDILVSLADEPLVESHCIRIAKEHGYHFALGTNFTNRCLLFWSAPADFVRVDIEDDVRWRIFPVVSAVTILAGKQIEGAFYVPSALGESLVIAAKVAWMGELTQRYHQRLEILHKELTAAGSAPIPPNEQAIINLARGNQAQNLRKHLIQRALLSPSTWPTVAAAFATDFMRMAWRLLIPPGYHVLYSGTEPVNWPRLSSYLSLALPSQKSFYFSGRKNFKRIFFSLFRSGLVFEEILHATPPAPGPSLRSYKFLSTSIRKISVFRPNSQVLYLTHEDSGWMKEIHYSGDDHELALTSFIGDVMARNKREAARDRSRRQPRGKFIVLVGLDGAGKTTFARNLCGALAETDSCRKVRYYHWIPSLFRRSYPWPALAETPRKKAEQGGLNSLLSTVRLLKNLLHARWIYHIGIRNWTRKGEDVVVDRYLYNYWLDPVSLRYSGPTWLLDLTARMMPKPDLIFSLETDADTLLSRKKELTREEIALQSTALQKLPLHGVRKVVLDAGLSPSAVLESALHALREFCGKI